jgi:MFS family permease
MPQSPPARALGRAHVGVVLTFALVGVVNGVLAARLPGLAGKLALTDGDVGLVILSWGVAAAVTTQCMRWLVTTVGHRLLLRVSGPLLTVAVALIALSPSFPLLLAAAACFGTTFGVTESMINIQGGLLERLASRPLMNGLHAGWSAGAVTGGLLAAALAALDVSYTVSVLGVALAVLPIIFAAGWTYLDEPGNEAEESVGRRGLPAIVFLVGAIAFLGLLLEGLVGDWSGLLLTSDLRASAALAAIAYPVFELAMFCGRLFGDRLSLRFNARSVLTAAGAAAALGVMLIVTAPSATLAIVGFGLTGMTVCVVVPLSMSLAGKLAPGHSAAAVAQVSAMGYAGLLAGPVAIGFVAEASTLRTGISMGMVAALLIAVGSRSLPINVIPIEATDPESAADVDDPSGHPSCDTSPAAS